MLKIPLFEWDLENYSSIVKISIEEADGIETQRESTTTTSEFATNFEFNAEWQTVVKLGGKFGASSKNTVSTVFDKTRTLGNDELGDVLINFADLILTGDMQTVNYEKVPKFNNKYYASWYKIELAPLQMY